MAATAAVIARVAGLAASPHKAIDTPRMAVSRAPDRTPTSLPTTGSRAPPLMANIAIPYRASANGPRRLAMTTVSVPMLVIRTATAAAPLARLAASSGFASIHPRAALTMPVMVWTRSRSGPFCPSMSEPIIAFQVPVSLSRSPLRLSRKVLPILSAAPVTSPRAVVPSDKAFRKLGIWSTASSSRGVPKRAIAALARSAGSLIRRSAPAVFISA
ncbi:hypothetical protein D3C79_661400 [compost metagenome]